MAASFDDFRAFSSILLGGMAGALAAIPVSAMAAPPFSYLLIVSGAALGFAAGYRRRRSPGFFYFVLICVCILALIAASSGFGPSRP